MGDYSQMVYPFFSTTGDNPNNMFGMPTTEENPIVASKPNDPPPPPPIVICPTEVDNINITLEKNQQCACKDCGKLFNSVWYLKQHAVKHSNDRPFKCKFCFKTYKFRSNLYQHKCPDRQKHQGLKRGLGNLSGNAKRIETNQLLKNKIEASLNVDELTTFTASSMSDGEENDIPITYGLLIHRFEENNIPLPSNPAILPEPPKTPVEEPARPLNCIREHPLPEHDIELYLNENKNKLQQCRKCRLHFPTSASLMRHAAAHSREDMFPYKCTNCRQAFESEKDLRRHSQVHSGLGPWRCDQCLGLFRSSPALRRHQDQCRQCLPDNSDILLNINSPIDPFSFIPSESELFNPSLENKSPDSGVGTSPGQSSPESRTHLLEVDPYDMYHKKKDKEDDEDSGFRSRLNSVTQSSPGSSSAFSHDGESPHRKPSDTETNNLFSDNFGNGQNYGQQLFYENGADSSLLMSQKEAHFVKTENPIWGH